MNPSMTTSFRFDRAFAEALDRMAASYGLSKTEVVRQSVLIVGTLFRAAHLNALADLATLRERHGDDAVLTVTVWMAADGTPHGHVEIDGKEVDGVTARPFIDRDANEAHVFLEVDRERGEEPNMVPFGKEWLFLEHPPRLLVGRKLPWPPSEMEPYAIIISLGGLAKLLPEPAEAVAVEA